MNYWDYDVYTYVCIYCIYIYMIIMEQMLLVLLLSLDEYVLCFLFCLNGEMNIIAIVIIPVFL